MRPSSPPTLSQIAQSGALLNQVPQWNGSLWIPASLSGVIPGGGSKSQPLLNTAPGTASWTPRDYNPMAYGALGTWNGSSGADDTAAIVAMVNDVNAGSGARIYWPPGGYKCTVELIFTVPVIMEGATCGNRYNEANAFAPQHFPCIIYFTNDTPGIWCREYSSRITNLEVTGNQPAGTLGSYAGGTSDGIIISGPDSVLDNVCVTAFSRDGFHYDNVNPQGSSDNTTHLQCKALGNARNGFFAQGGDSQNMAFWLCNASANGYWGFFNGGADAKILSAAAGGGASQAITVTTGYGKYFSPKTLFAVDPINNGATKVRTITAVAGDVVTVAPGFPAGYLTTQTAQGGGRASQVASVNGLTSLTVTAGDGTLFSSFRTAQTFPMTLTTAAGAQQTGTGTISGDTITWTTPPGTTPNVGDTIFITGTGAGANTNKFYSCHTNGNALGDVWDSSSSSSFYEMYVEGASNVYLGYASYRGTWWHPGAYGGGATLAKNGVDWTIFNNGSLQLPSAGFSAFGKAPVGQQARPVTLADVINLLVAYGWSA